MMQELLEDHFTLKREAKETSRSTAVYISQMTGELAGLANRAEMPILAYFLNLARLEALNSIDNVVPLSERESSFSS
jgi:hypothetical protein